LLNYGDFGIGTFENLDGEMVVLDGAVYLKQIGGQDRVDDKTAFVTSLPTGSKASTRVCRTCWWRIISVLRRNT